MAPSAAKTASPNVAVIGAGLSGSNCARRLVDRGARVTIFEKSRGVGGRMATRRSATGLQFDHGAQYFTARTPEFRSFVERCRERELVAEWRGRIATIDGDRIEYRDADEPRYVGRPRMNSLCHALADGLDIRFETQVASVTPVAGRWRLVGRNGDGLGTFDAVLFAVPAPQAAVLWPEASPAREVIAAVRMRPCWAAMVSLRQPSGIPFDGAFVRSSPLSWVARDCTKPAREAAPETWVLHGSPDWSADHLEDAPDEVAKQLLDAFREIVADVALRIETVDAHRWRFALPAEPLERPSLFDGERLLGACGDWCGGPRVEGAFLSGQHLGDEISRRFPALAP